MHLPPANDRSFPPITMLYGGLYPETRRIRHYAVLRNDIKNLAALRTRPLLLKHTTVSCLTAPPLRRLDFK